jgi:lipooligosaccharide transport system permease protein
MAALSLADGLSRQLDYWVTVYRRTWRGSIVSSFGTPLFYVLAMGVLLGGFIEADPDTLEGATSYLAFVVPGLIAAQAMQTAAGETMYPVMAMIKWQKVYDSMLATPLTCRDVVAAHLGFVLFRLVTVCGAYTVVTAFFGVYATWWGPILALLSQILVGMVFAVWIYGYSARLRSDTGFNVIYRLVIFPLFLFSGAFFPISNLGDVGAWVARCTPLWHGVNLSRMFALDHVTWWLAGVNVLVLVALLVTGSVWAVRGLERRLVS